jgi:two-component system CheB/CheR fusion protein
MAEDVDHELEQLLDYVRDNRGFDFTGYKRPSLTRRIRKRMQEVGIDSFSGYQDYLEVHPEEFTHLFNTILINVTGFFRDPEAWEFLADEALPLILQKKRPNDPIRIWSVGCASGEEAYTVAMVVAEAVGVDQLRDRVKIYATDVDEEALAEARAGVFSAKAVEAIPEELREKYLEPRGADGFAFRKDLRRAVIFGRHDLVNDAPISRVDLIVCRNTLMYFNSDTQSRIYNGFQFALNPEGLLFLGKSEMFLTRTNIFTPVDMKRRVFMRLATPADETRRRDFTEPAAAGEIEDALRSALFDSAAAAQVIVSPDGRLVAANRRAAQQLGLSEADVGRPFQDLEVSYRPIELRSRIERATTERRAVQEPALSWTTRTGENLTVDVEVAPLVAGDELLGVSVTFTDVTRAHEMSSDLERARRELETAYEEIQSTVEELETTNEELQSTNEELETTNEELQSTNEELETMNEELQSTNEELETINTELFERTSQLNQANVFLASVLESLRAGVVVVDRDLAIESWNSLAEDMWGLRADEVQGKNLLALDIGLPVEQLRPTIREVLEGSRDSGRVVVEATDRRGRKLQCQVDCMPMRDGDVRNGAILLMEPVG